MAVAVVARLQAFVRSLLIGGCMLFTRILAQIANLLRWFKGWAVYGMSAGVVGGVVSAVLGGVFFVMVVEMISVGIDRLNAALAYGNSVKGSFLTATSSVDSSFLSKVNFFLPLDTLATVFSIYVSIWVAVELFRRFRMYLGFAHVAMEKVPGQ